MLLGRPLLGKQGLDVLHRELHELFGKLAVSLLVDLLKDQAVQVLPCLLVPLKLLRLDKAFKSGNGLRHPHAHGRTVDAVLLDELGGSVFDVRCIEQRFASLAACRHGQALRVETLAESEVLQDLTAHAVIHLHIGDQNAAKLVVQQVDVLWSEALGHRSNLRCRQFLLLGQQALEQALALGLCSTERLFHRLAGLRSKGAHQVVKLLLVLVDAGLGDLQLLRSELVQQFRLALQERAVHGPLSGVEHESGLGDSGIRQRLFKLFQRFLRFAALGDRAEHLRKLALSVFHQQCWSDADNRHLVHTRKPFKDLLFQRPKA